jgi:hypothetical protein
MMLVVLFASLSVGLALLALFGYGIDAYLFAIAAQRERETRPRSAIQIAIDEGLESPLEYAIWSCMTIILWVPSRIARLFRRRGA